MAGKSSGKAHSRFLALHFRGAGANEEAFWYATLAAEEAEAVFAYEDAAASYRLAVELAPDDSDRMRQQVKLSIALHYAGRSEEGARFYFAAATRARRGTFERSIFDQIVDVELGITERILFGEWQREFLAYQIEGGED